MSERCGKTQSGDCLGGCDPAKPCKPLTRGNEFDNVTLVAKRTYTVRQGTIEAEVKQTTQEDMVALMITALQNGEATVSWEVDDGKTVQAP